METPPLSSLYQQVILDHYRKPRNKGEMEDAPLEVHLNNPTCGDEIRLQLRIENDVVTDAKFIGQGCSISQASVSMMTDLIIGEKLDTARHVLTSFTEMMHGDEEASKDRALGNLRSLQGVSKFPVRIRCALLGFDALQRLLNEHAESS